MLPVIAFGHSRLWMISVRGNKFITKVLFLAIEKEEFVGVEVL